MKDLRPYQREDIAWLLSDDRPSAVYSAQPGLGKTAVALHVHEALRVDHGALIVCPPAAISAWRDEHETWAAVNTQPVQLRGRQSWRWPRPGEALIVTYACLPWRPVEIHAAVADGKKHGPASGKPTCPTHLIVDECQALQDNKSQRHQRLRALRKKCAKTTGLSGTPVGGTPFALYHMLGALGCLPWSWPGFLRRFSAHELPFGGYEFERDKAGAIIVDPRVPLELARVLRRRLRKDVAAELPPKIYRDTVIPHKRDTKKALTEILCNGDLAKEWIDISEAMAPFYDSADLPELVDFSRVDRLMAEERIPHIAPAQKEREDRGEIGLFFAAHSEPLRVAGSRAGWGLIDGSTSQARRESLVKDFEAGRLLGLAINVFTASTALNLPSADYVLFIDESWDPTVNEQASDRPNRLSRTKGPIEVERWISDHAVCKHRRRVLERKRQLGKDTLNE